MREIYDRLYDETLDARRTGITSDDLSKAMVPWIRHIEGISKADHPRSLERAYYLLKVAAECSYNAVSGYGDRRSDKPADELMVRLFRARLLAGETWDWTKELKEFEDEAKNLKEYDIEEWFPETRKVLKECVEKTEKAAGEAGANHQESVINTTDVAKGRESPEA